MSVPSKRKKKYKQLSIDERLEIIRRLEAGEKTKISPWNTVEVIPQLATSSNKKRILSAILNYWMLSKEVGRKRGWTQSRILS